jgi:hypothetical protein
MPDSQVTLGSHLIHSFYWSILRLRCVIHEASFLLVCGLSFFHASGMKEAESADQQETGFVDDAPQA